MRRLELMLAELEGNQLQTVLAPSRRHDRREWDQVRVNISVNPKWYQKFCALHLSKRAVRKGKPDTIVRRRETVASLTYLIKSGGVPFRNQPTHHRLLDFARGLKL